MPKGRRCNPSTDCDGVWYQHQGTNVGNHLIREKSTETGEMFTKQTSSLQIEPPRGFQEKYTKVFKEHNKFSAHDNREKLCNDGEILLSRQQNRIIGRRLVAEPERNLHHTEPDMLTHYGRQVTRFDYNTIYSDNYRGCSSSESTLRGFRKFPRHYPDPQPELKPYKSWSCISNEFANEESFIRMPRRRTIEMMALTQKLPDNNASWKYSYHRLSRCYPAGFSKVDGDNSYLDKLLKYESFPSLPQLSQTRRKSDVIVE